MKCLTLLLRHQVASARFVKLLSQIQRASKGKKVHVPYTASAFSEEDIAFLVEKRAHCTASPRRAIVFL
ncbi:MAG: hypothetical protein QI197_03295 [Candidatus Korarchaeota archaeon]|nr:hypothetical protein [Candidatus Korarchaeota archaeon]